MHLAHAARIYPKLWHGMETARPASLILSLDEAFEFLQESAWVLEDAGFRVIIPARLTPKGRQRAKIRLRTRAKKGGDYPQFWHKQGSFIAVMEDFYLRMRKNNQNWM